MASRVPLGTQRPFVVEANGHASEPPLSRSVRVAAGGVTVTVAVAEPVPLGPVHVSTKGVVAAGVTVSDPDVGLLPVQPPEAVQAVARVRGPH